MAVSVRCPEPGCKTENTVAWSDIAHPRCSTCGSGLNLPISADLWEPVKRQLRVRYVTGRVVNVESQALPLVSGSGQISTEYRPLTPTRGYSDVSGRLEIESRVSVRSRLWIRELSGRETLVESLTAILAVRQGQTVSALYVTNAATGKEEWVAIVNHTSGDRQYVQDPESVLRSLGIEPRWTETARASRPKRALSTRGIETGKYGVGSFGGFGVGGSGLVLCAIGASLGQPVLLLLGIVVTFGGFGYALYLISTARHQPAALPPRRRTVRCSVEGEFAEMIRGCIEARFTTLPPPT